MATSKELDAERAVLLLDSERLYEGYGTPLEAEHGGRIVASTPDGRTALGESVLDVMVRSNGRFGLGSFVFVVGERSVGRL